jgi:hypothetical protein
VTLGELKSRIFTKVEENPSAPVYYSTDEVRDSINEAQRLFAFLTLCLESIRPFVLTPGVRFYSLLKEWVDWIAPLRVRLSNDVAEGSTAEYDAVMGDSAMFNEQVYTGLTASTAPRLEPSTLAEMCAENADWLTSTGIPDRYGCLGFDLLFLNRATTIPGIKLLIAYARSPVRLVEDPDVPEIPEADHEVLIDGALSLLRLKEGGQELAASLTYLGRFLEATGRRVRQVRARSLAQRYDKLPLELEHFDASRLLKLRPDLPPHRKEAPVAP